MIINQRGKRRLQGWKSYAEEGLSLTTMLNWLLTGKKNMNNRILIDTNVLLDYLLMREPFYKEAKRIVISCVDGRVKGCIAVHSISNIFYILRKDYSIKERREVLSELCSIFDVEGIDKAKLVEALQNENFSDFEDCLQIECAKAYGAEYIVTRDAADYKASEIKAIMPKEYLETFLM